MTTDSVRFSALSPLVRQYRMCLVRSIVTDDTFVPLAARDTNRHT